jgi:anti-sigma factor ChrR (cupin superfamily)
MKLLPSCHEVQTNLTEYAEGTLPFREKVGIWVHLLLCRVCAGVLRGLQAIPGIAKVSLAPGKEAPDAAFQALAKVQATLRKDRS